MDSTAKAISFLPLSHIYERMLMYLYMSAGVSIYFQESLEDLGDRIRDVQPHVFTAVPRLIEKIYDKIVAKGEALTGHQAEALLLGLGPGLALRCARSELVVRRATRHSAQAHLQQMERGTRRQRARDRQWKCGAATALGHGCSMPPAYR